MLLAYVSIVIEHTVDLLALAFCLGELHSVLNDEPYYRTSTVTHLFPLKAH